MMEELNMLKSRLTFFITAALFIFTSVLRAGTDSRWLFEEGRFASTDFKIVWQYNLPLSENELLDRLLVREKQLFALTNRNYLTCLNRTDANVIFSSFIARAGLPLTGLEYYKGTLMTMVGSKLVELNTELGSEKTSEPAKVGVTCPVVRNDSFYYYAGLDKRLHALKADNKVQVFEAAAETDSLITSVLAEENLVVFAAEAGNVICMTPDGPKKVWQFDAPKAIAGALVCDADSLYIACKDTKVYCLELTTGHLLWKYQTQAILDAAPQPGDKAVYQYVSEIGLIALDKKMGNLLWKVDGGIGLLAELGDKAFIITKTGALVAMDNAKQKQVYTIDFGTPVKYATNTMDSMIYVSDGKGRLACLQPAR
jgi:outer membrane protein assembly factor BamB